MTRTHTTLVTAALLVLVGCKFGWEDTGEDSDDNAVKTHSYDFEASSLLLSDDGREAVMGTSAGVVVFDVASGDPSATTPSEDFTEPLVETWVGDQVAIVDRGLDAGVFLWTPGELSYDLREDDEGANASNARGFDGGLAWIGRRAENCRVLRDGLDLATLQPCGYIRDLDIVRSSGALFLGYDDDEAGTTYVMRLDPDGSQVQIDAPIDHLSWDDTRQTLFVAAADSSTVQAVTADGGPVFSVEIDGTIVDLLALEQEGLLAVLATKGADAHVHIVDQYTGDELRLIDTASSSTGLAASADSSTIAILQADRLAILEIDWDRLLTDDTGE